MLDDKDAGAWQIQKPRAGVLLSTLLHAVALQLTLSRVGVFVCRGAAAHFWLLGTKTVTVFVVVWFEPSVQATVMV
jgi:hypothetical protein